MKGLIVEAANWQHDKDSLMALRRQVFVEEQNVPMALEIDGLDPECKHVKAIANGLTIGTGRLLPSGFIGRMCVHKNYRQFGVGSLLLNNLLEQAVTAEYSHIALNSQCEAISFYEKHGFVVNSAEFIDAGIPHRKMVLKI